MTRQRSWRWAAGGTVALLIGLVFAVWAATAWAQRDDYRAARPCPGAPARGCAVDATAVVERTRVGRHGKRQVWLRHTRLDLATADPGRPVTLPAPGRAFAALTPDRAVGVRVWNGRVARVDVPGVGSAETTFSPLVTSLEVPLVAGGLLVGGAFALWYGLAPWPAQDAGATPPAAPFLASAGVAFVLPAMVVDRFDLYDPRVLLAPPAIGALLWVLTGRRRGRAPLQSFRQT